MSLESLIEKIPFAKKAEVLAYHDCGLIAINKGAGLLSHPNPRPVPPPNFKGKLPPEPPALINAPYNLQREYYSLTDEEGKRIRIFLLNRLDSPTSGVIFLATNPEVADAVKFAFKEKVAKKIYYALCSGRLVAKHGEWKDLLKTQNLGSHLRAAKGAGGAEALTKYTQEKLDANSLGISLMRLEPITGKTHQLRVQCAQRKIPIIGDASYGNFALNKFIKNIVHTNRLFLHCAETYVEFMLGDELIKFSAKAPLPESFNALLDYNASIIMQTKGFKR